MCIGCILICISIGFKVACQILPLKNWVESLCAHWNFFQVFLHPGERKAPVVCRQKPSYNVGLDPSGSVHACQIQVKPDEMTHLGQEFEKRGFYLLWTVATGQMAGLHVLFWEWSFQTYRNSFAALKFSVCQFYQVTRSNGTGSLSSPWRKGLANLSSRPAASGNVIREIDVPFFSCYCFWLQGVSPMSFEQIQSAAHQCHHLRNKPPVSKWLLQSRGQGHEFRLRACGNVVIPRCADLALHILAAMHQQKFPWRNQ